MVFPPFSGKSETMMARFISTGMILLCTTVNSECQLLHQGCGHVDERARKPIQRMFPISSQSVSNRGRCHLENHQVHEILKPLHAGFSTPQSSQNLPDSVTRTWLPPQAHLARLPSGLAAYF